MDLNTPLPRTWKELVDIKDTLREADRRFLRLEDELNDYISFCKIIPRELRVRLILRQIGNQDVALLVNRYPYTRLLQHLPLVKHYSLWCKSAILSDEKISEIVTEKFPRKQWIAVESTIKSMPEIWHTHVFVNNG